MKTKFDSLVKIKKNETKKIEKNIHKINSSIEMLKNRIKEIKTKLSTLTFPKNGNFSEFNHFKAMQNILINEMNEYKNQINILENRKKELFEMYKKANIEYEKMKYLQAEEIKKLIKKQKQKENIEMDEITIILNKKRFESE